MPYAGELSAIATAVCWSITAIFFSEAGRRLGSFRVNAVRLLIAVSIYTVILLITTGQLIPDQMNMKQFIWLALSGLIGLVIGDGCGFKALVMIGPRLTTLLWSTAPIMATVMAWIFLGERLQIIHITGILITLAGVSWVVAERRYSSGNHFSISDEHPDTGSLAKGITLGLVAAFGQAAGLILSKHAMMNLGSELDALSSSYIRMLTSMIMIWVFASIRGEFKHTLNAFRHRSGMLFSLGGAVFGPFLGVWSSLIAVKYIAAGIAATLNATTPIWIIPNVVLYYKEKVSVRAILGVIIAVSGIALLFLSDNILN